MSDALPQPDTWHVLVCGLPIEGESYDLGSAMTLRRLLSRLSVFDLAAVGAAGFREWAVLEPLAPSATAEISSPLGAADLPGYDALNKCWLVSALLVLRGYVHHLCPAACGYSWDLIAGHQIEARHAFRKQLSEEGVGEAVYRPRSALPPFNGSLLDFHLRILVPKVESPGPFGPTDAEWFRTNLPHINRLAAGNERFRFALQAAIDWRYSKDLRAAMARLWAGIESVFAVSSELVYRVSLLSSVVTAPRGPKRFAAFREVKTLYSLRSKAVHGEPIIEEKLALGVAGSFNLLRQLLVDAIGLGRLRTEDELNSELLG
jgi:hypothetical protein